MARICFITPGHLSTNPRVVKAAGALKAAGHDVHVVHGRFSAWGVDNDRAIAEELGSTRPVAYGPHEASRATYVRQTALRRVALGLARLGSFREYVAETAHSPVVRDLRAAALAWRADLYVAHYVAALPAAASAARRYRVPFAFDAEDYHLGDLPDRPEHALEKAVIRLIEGRYLGEAAFVTAASPLIGRAYAETYGVPLPTTVLNLFSRFDAPRASSAAGTAVPGPSVYWFSQTIGPGRGLEAAVEAIARARSKPHLYLRGTPRGPHLGSLCELAERLGVADRLHVLDPIPPAELERDGAAYDVGYVGEVVETRNRQLALTNKLFSYLISGIPVIASDIPAHQGLAEHLRKAMRLFRGGDAESLASAMDALFLQSDELSSARADAWELGQERYNWEAEAPKLVSVMESVL